MPTSMVGLWRYLSRSTVLAFGLQTAQGYAASSISGFNILPPLDSPSPLSPVASNHAQRLMEEKDEQGTEGKEGEKDTPLLQIDPKCFQDALRTFFQPIKNDDARLDFYTMYKREATEYDADYVKKYDEDLNTTLIFAGLFSAVSSAFVIDVHSGLQPNPNDQTAALLRAILLTLNQSAIPNETPTVPPVQESPPSEVVTVTALMYASLLISLLAAFIAMLGKQWLNRYLRNAGGSMIERCGDRQRKCDGLKKWPFYLFVESLPVMLQVALLLLACGLCKHMASINTSVATVLIAFTVLGVLFYLGIVIVGTSSYECPFQTPVSTALRRLWKTVKPHIAATLHPIVATGTSLLWLPMFTALRRLWGTIQCQILHMVHLLPSITQRHHSHHQPLPVTRRTPQQPVSWFASLHSLWKNVQHGISRAVLHLSWTQPLSTPVTPPTSLWLTPTALATLRNTNTSDVRCISWILWNITDPEALDAAIRLAATIWWFENGLNVEPPYDQIIFTLEGCFDSNGKIYPGSRDRVYYCAQAVLWIHIRALCVSREFARRFPFPTIVHDTTSLDPDLSWLLRIYTSQDTPDMVLNMYAINSESTPAHFQWTSNALLHLSWAMHSVPDTFDKLSQGVWVPTSKTIPLNAVLNRLLTSCIFLGWPVEEDLLKIQVKIDRFNQILSQFSQVMAQAIHTSHPHCGHFPGLLNHLRNSRIQTKQLTEMAYQWCSVVCENLSTLKNGKDILLLSLEIGFRHLDPGEDNWIEAELTHTEHHQGLADIIFGSEDHEAIADLLHAWTSTSTFHEPYVSLDICAKYLIGLHHLDSFSPRLRQLIIYAIELIGYQPFEQVDGMGFIGLLNNLEICVEDMNDRSQWAKILLDTIQSSKEIQYLSLLYWELLVELAVSHDWLLKNTTYSPYTTAFLEEAEEWQKLECWMGIVWMVWLQEEGNITEDLEHVTLLLFHQKPGAIQKLRKWIEHCDGWMVDSLQQICSQMEVEAPQQVMLETHEIDGEAMQSNGSQPSTLPLHFGYDTF